MKYSEVYQNLTNLLKRDSRSFSPDTAHSLQGFGFIRLITNQEYLDEKVKFAHFLCNPPLNEYFEIGGERHVGITALGKRTLEDLSRCVHLKENSVFNFNINQFYNNYQQRIQTFKLDGQGVPLETAFETSHSESIVPFIPDMIRLTMEHGINGYYSRFVTSFFASLAYDSAVPYLIDSLKCRKKMPVEQKEDILGSHSHTESYDRAGSSGAAEGEDKITEEEVRITTKWGFPIADGAKTALLKIKDKNKELSDRINVAITEFDQNRPKDEITAEETTRTNTESIWCNNFFY